MKYAIVKIGGSQYKIVEGNILDVDRIDGEKGKQLNFKEVLLLVEEKKIHVGQPFVENAKIEAEVIGQIKGKKIRVATYKAKSRYRRVKGFRALITRIKIKSIKSPAKTRKPSS